MTIVEQPKTLSLNTRATKTAQEQPDREVRWEIDGETDSILPRNRKERIKV